MYKINVVYPKEELRDENIDVVGNKKGTLTCETAEDVIALRETYLRRGYDVKTHIHNDDHEVTPFDIARNLTTKGLEYTAALGIKGTYDYTVMLAISHLLENYDIPFIVDAKLKIDDESTINIDHIETWNNATYKVTPKYKTSDINELVGVYGSLSEHISDYQIDIKVKNSKTDDDFIHQLDAYPEDSTITLTLKEYE